MSDPRPDDLRLEWLAAYVDGELTPRERARVENWLADNPEARELLENQESLAPGNADFWQVAKAPEPSPAQWSRVRLGIERANPIRPRRSWAGWVGTLGVLATAASLFLVLGNPDRPVSQRTDIDDAPTTVVADDEPFAMATADDVRIISLPESAAEWLVVGDHPLHGSAMALARFGEVEFYGVGSDLAGRFPELPSDPNTEEIPMIWAPRAP